MTDLLIRGMEMPVTPEDDPYVDIRIFADGTAVTSKSGKPFYTQYSVIFLPPHGRLIDADALIELYEPAPEDVNEWEHYTTTISVIRQNIKDAPTVIEAEG